MKALWEGYGKTDNTDSSNSGYDFSLVKLLLSYGFKNVDELATVLAHRPNGVVQTKNKDERYLQHTIANAILK